MIFDTWTGFEKKTIYTGDESTYTYVSNCFT